MNRQLPSPDKLYALIIEKNLSYSEVAKRYNMHRVNVIGTFKRDCLARGIEWPIPRNRNMLIRQGHSRYSIDSFGIVEALREYMEDTGLSQRQIAAKSGVNQASLSRLLNETCTRIRPQTAKRLMTGIGEEMADSLKNWTPLSAPGRNGNGGGQKKRKPHEDILDEWQFLRECGWTDMAKIAAKIGVSYDTLEILIRRNKDDERVGNLTYVQRYTRAVLDAA